MKMVDIILIVLVIILAIVAGVWYFDSKSDKVSFSPTTSRVQIGVLIAATESANLADGIDFGSVTGANISAGLAFNLNSTDNYNGAGQGTTLFVTRHHSSTTSIKICLSANTNLIEQVAGLSIIGLNNETYNFSDSTSSSSPGGPIGTTSLTTTNVIASPNLTAGSNTSYYRFWLDIPPGTYAAGTYNNTVTFTAVRDVDPCP